MTTVLDGKGRVVIPQRLRDKLNLHTGDDFTITTEAGAVLLKKIPAEPPPNKLEKKAKGRGLRPS